MGPLGAVAGSLLGHIIAGVVGDSVSPAEIERITADLEAVDAAVARLIVEGESVKADLAAVTEKLEKAQNEVSSFAKIEADKAAIEVAESAACAAARATSGDLLVRADAAQCSELHFRALIRSLEEKASDVMTQKDALEEERRAAGVLHGRCL